MTYTPGKFDSARDAALFYLCSNGWSTGDTGDSSDYGLSTWKISNTLPEVQRANTEITSLLEDFLKSEDIEDSDEFRASLVGNFLVCENSSGFVTVVQCPSEQAMNEEFAYAEQAYAIWFAAAEQD